MLIHNEVVCSKNANVIDSGTKILSVSSNRPSEKQKNLSEPTDAGDLAENVSDEFFFDENYEQIISMSNYDLDGAHNHSLAYMSSMIENKIINSKRTKRIIKCDECLSAFIENELTRDMFISFKTNKTGATQPCKSTFEICKFVDVLLKANEMKAINYRSVLFEILRKIPFDKLYTSTSFETHLGDKSQNHKYNFVKTIVQLYMDMKSVYLARCYTLKTHDEPIVRQNFRKIIHRKGQ